MAYSTATSILLILPGFPQTSSSEGYSLTVEILNSHITRADARINSIIAERYDVSNFTTTVPPLLRLLSEDITSYYAMRSEYSGDNQNVNEWIDKYEMAVEQLNEIRDGKASLVDTSGSLIEEREADSDTGYVSSSTEDYTPAFDVDGFLDQKFDDNRISDITDERK